MKHLILSGGGDIDQSGKTDDVYFSLLKRDSKILYLPIAWQDGKYDGCLAWFSKLMEKYSIKDYTMWEEVADKTFDDVDAFDAIYIGGGNTFKLLSELRETGFIKTLEQFIENGKPVYGGSAGAIILGKSIATASFGEDSDVNDVGMTNLTGLDEIKGHVIQCHYRRDQDAEISAWVESNRLPIISIGESSGIHVTDDEIEPIGDEVFLFDVSGSISKLDTKI